MAHLEPGGMYAATITDAQNGGRRSGESPDNNQGYLGDCRTQGFLRQREIAYNWSIPRGLLALEFATLNLNLGSVAVSSYYREVLMGHRSKIVQKASRVPYSISWKPLQPQSRLQVLMSLCPKQGRVNSHPCEPKEEPRVDKIRDAKKLAVTPGLAVLKLVTTMTKHVAPKLLVVVHMLADTKWVATSRSLVTTAKFAGQRWLADKTKLAAPNSLTVSEFPAEMNNPVAPTKLAGTASHAKSKKPAGTQSACGIYRPHGSQRENGSSASEVSKDEIQSSKDPTKPRNPPKYGQVLFHSEERWKAVYRAKSYISPLGKEPIQHFDWNKLRGAPHDCFSNDGLL